MIAKNQKENIQILIETLTNPNCGKNVITKWLQVLTENSFRHRRPKKELCVLSQEKPQEVYVMS